MVYDVTNPDSFANMDDWLAAVRKHCKTRLVYLVANKIDLISLRQVSEKQQDAFIRQNDLAGGFYVSAKTGDNLVKAFYHALLCYAMLCSMPRYAYMCTYDI